MLHNFIQTPSLPGVPPTQRHIPTTTHASIRANSRYHHDHQPLIYKLPALRPPTRGQPLFKHGRAPTRASTFHDNRIPKDQTVPQQMPYKLYNSQQHPSHTLFNTTSPLRDDLPHKFSAGTSDNFTGVLIQDNNLITRRGNQTPQPSHPLTWKLKTTGHKVGATPASITSLILP
eukprot:jgi/Botrbrau1/7302/Bobra.0318s0034.1